MTLKKDGPIECPERTPPMQQSATASTDGSKIIDRPAPFKTHEIAKLARWVTKVDEKDRDAAIDVAVEPLGRLCKCAGEFAKQRLLDRSLGVDPEGSSYNLLLVYAPELNLDLFASALASAFFRDGNAFEVFNCQLQENSCNGLFGTPVGYSGHLDGGKITNRFTCRPETVVVLDHFECADAGTFMHMRRLARGGATRGLARGGQDTKINGDDAIFVMSSTRAFERVAKQQLLLDNDGLGQGTSPAGTDQPHHSREEAQRPDSPFTIFSGSVKDGRPDLAKDWELGNEQAFLYARLCVWAKPTQNASV